MSFPISRYVCSKFVRWTSSTFQNHYTTLSYHFPGPIANPVRLTAPPHHPFSNQSINMSHPTNQEIISNALFNLKGRVALVTG
jgi:hypothetical protein